MAADLGSGSLFSQLTDRWAENQTDFRRKANLLKLPFFIPPQRTGALIHRKPRSDAAFSRIFQLHLRTLVCYKRKSMVRVNWRLLQTAPDVGVNPELPGADEGNHFMHLWSLTAELQISDQTSDRSWLRPVRHSVTPADREEEVFGLESNLEYKQRRSSGPSWGSKQNQESCIILKRERPPCLEVREGGRRSGPGCPAEEERRFRKKNNKVTVRSKILFIFYLMRWLKLIF